MAQYVLNFFRSFYQRLSSITSVRLSSDVSRLENLLEICELKLRKCNRTEELYEALTDVFYKIFPSIKYCHVYLGYNTLVDASGEQLPVTGFSSQIWEARELQQNIHIKRIDPLYNQIKAHVEPKRISTLGVGFLPIPTSDDKRLAAAVLFVSEKLELDSLQLEYIDMICEAIPEVYTQISGRMEQSAISLIKDLNRIDDNPCLTQLTIIRHLKNEVKAEYGFLLVYSEHDDDFVVKISDDKVIQERRIPTSNAPTLMSHLKSRRTANTSITKELRKDLLVAVGRVHASHVMIVPIIHNSHSIGLLVLLSANNRFNPEALTSVISVLDFCTSFIYKDLMLERERTIRLQTEKLHQVAKNIFTHLGQIFEQIIRDSYQRLFDLVAVPLLPSIIQATHDTSNYKNLYIPNLGCQRLMSLDNRLLVIGPRSKRHSLHPALGKQAADEGSECSGFSSVIDSFETGHYLDEYDLVADQLITGGSGAVPREKTTAQLGNIYEETEASCLDTVITTDSANCDQLNGKRHSKSARHSEDKPRLSAVHERVHRKSAGARARSNSNNNADKEDSGSRRKPQRSSKLSLRQSRHTPYQQSPVLHSHHTAMQPSQNAESDVMSQFIGMSADVPPSARPSRGSSVLGVNQRPSTFNTMGSRANVSSALKGSKQKSILMVTSLPTIHSPSPPALTYEYHASERSDDILKSKLTSVAERSSNTTSILENDALGRNSKITTNRQSASDNQNEAIMEEGSKVTVLSQQQQNLLLPLVEKGLDSRKNSITEKDSKLLSTNSVLTYISESKSTKISDASNLTAKESRNDSVESVDMKRFHAALKKDILNTKSPVLNQRRRSLFDEHNDHERRNSLESNDYEKLIPHGRQERSESMDARTITKHFGKSSKISMFDIKPTGFTSIKDRYGSHDAFSSALPPHRQLKQGSNMSLIDISRGGLQHGKTLARKVEPAVEAKGRKNTVDSTQPIRLSVMSLDTRAKETFDSRIAIADKLGYQRASLLPLDNELVHMTIAASEAGMSPMRKRFSTADASNHRKKHSSLKVDDDYVKLLKPFVQPPVAQNSATSPVHNKGVQIKPVCESLGIQVSLNTSRRPTIEVPYSLKLSQRSFEGNERQSYYGMSVDRNVQTSSSSTTKGPKKQGQRMLLAVDEPLMPLLAPISGTVIGDMSENISARSLYKKKLTGFPKTDSDIVTLLYDTCNQTNKESLTHLSPEDRRFEVKVISPSSGDSTLHHWRQCTLVTCKNSPVTHCSGIDENDLTVLLKEIMQEARTLTNAERCSVFLMEADAGELVAKVFDGHIIDDKEVRISATEGIAGHVVQTGKILNIKDAYSHPLFYRGVDESTGFKTRNILCFPIKDERDNIIGAAQLCNKIDATHFTSIDEDIAKALAAYCCISIVHSLMYRDVLDAHNRVKLANELMMFHMHVPNEELVQLVNQKVPPIISFGENLHLEDLKLSVPRNVDTKDMPLAVVSMFHELGFVQTFKLKPVTLARFVLMAKKGYRDPPYHNWFHAFSVAHFAFLLMKNLECISDGVLEDFSDFIKRFQPEFCRRSDLEGLAFLVAALCHDIDHRGTSNSFQVASNSVLAALYSSEGSVMERHHFSQTMCILNTEGCNIFENVSRTEYEQLLDLIRDIILATDIAHHLRIRNGLDAMAQVGFDKKNPEHKSLLLCLFMTASDLSDQTKPWKAAKQVSKMLYKEFFSQGDLEKALGRNPMEMMDRERASIPGLQIGFIDHIVLPAFNALKVIYPKTTCLVDNIMDNREHWSAIKIKTAERRDSVNSLEIFDFIDEEERRESVEVTDNEDS